MVWLTTNSKARLNRQIYIPKTPGDPDTPPGSSLIIADNLQSGISPEWDDIGVGVYNSTDKSVEFNYDGTEGYVYGLRKDFDPGVYGFCIQFEAKFTGGPRGAKFIKAFGTKGDPSATNYANVTPGITYSTGNLYEVNFGDGSTTENDTQCGLRLNGTVSGTPRATPNIVTSSSTFNPYSDQDWHKYRMFWLKNSGTDVGNEQADGRCIWIIDDVVRLEADNFFNRHPTNPRDFGSLELAGYSQAGPSCVLAYRNIKIWQWDGVAYS